MLEAHMSDNLMLIVRSMVVPYTVALGAFFLLVMGMEKGNDEADGKEADIYASNLSVRFMLKALLIQLGISMPVTIIVGNILRIMGLPTGSIGAEELFGNQFVIYIILLLLFNPIMEEVLFRKLVLDRLRVLGVTPAVIISAVFFALPHLYSQGIAQMLATFIIGIVWAYVRVKTGKLWPCMVLHGLYNLYGGYIAILMSKTVPTTIMFLLISVIILPIAAVLVLTCENKKTMTVNA
jgi:membrane protease YdiL (CAAX protease family)